MDVSPPPGPADLVYSYKPALLGAPFELCLTPTALEWRRGHYEGRVAYDRIRRVRLSFRPMTMQSQRFVAELWSIGGPKLQIVSASWRGLGNLEAQNRAYTAFVAELHRRVAAAGAVAVFETGISIVIYWIGIVAFTGTALGIAALSVRALQAGANLAALVIAAFVAVFLWQMGTFFRRNRPGTYRADALPPQLLP